MFVYAKVRNVLEFQQVVRLVYKV